MQLMYGLLPGRPRFAASKAREIGPGELGGVNHLGRQSPTRERGMEAPVLASRSDFHVWVGSGCQLDLTAAAALL